MNAVPDITMVLREHGPMLYRIAAGHMPSVPSRDDLAQDMSVAVWKALPAWRGDGSLKAFVARIAQYTALDHLRRRAEPTSHGEALLDLVESPLAGPDQHTESGQRRRRLLEAVRALPAGQRACVLLVLEGFGNREIAAILGIADNSVDQRLVRARQQLRNRLEASDGQ